MSQDFAKSSLSSCFFPITLKHCKTVAGSIVRPRDCNIFTSLMRNCYFLVPVASLSFNFDSFLLLRLGASRAMEEWPQAEFS